MLAAASIETWGSRKQKETYLMPLVSGNKLGAFALTEPLAGTDAANIHTWAELRDNRYILNGKKIFITNGKVADTFIVFAVTDPASGSRGISAFIIERGMPGFRSVSEALAPQNLTIME